MTYGIHTLAANIYCREEFSLCVVSRGSLTAGSRNWDLSFAVPHDET